MASLPKIPPIPDADRNASVTALLEILSICLEQIQELKDEIARLKGQKPKPKIKPSSLEKEPRGSSNRWQDVEPTVFTSFPKPHRAIDP
ncbi:MAG: hypothetical protein V1792_21310 [Pseudomonadota bacterium]